MKKRTIILLALLGVVVLLSAVNILQMHRLENELEAMAAEKAAEFKKEFASREETSPVRVASTAIASKSYLLFGPVTGKIALYIEHPAPNGQESLIEGYEFFYEHTKNSWRQTESGRCTSEQCTMKGRELLGK